MVTRQDISHEADKWVGANWRHQGRSLTHGIDCVGHIIVVANSLGLSAGFEDVLRYGRSPYHESLLQPLRDHLDEKPMQEIDIGDVAVFKDSKFPCHVGIVTAGDNDVLCLTHAYVRNRKVVKGLLSGYTDAQKTESYKLTMTHCFEFRGVK